jgi:hypothetical protein
MLDCQGPYEWDRSQRAVAVVRGDAGGVGIRGVDRGCGEDSCQLRAEAEDRPARCGTADEASGRGSLSADLGAHGGRAGRAAVALASSQAGAYAHAGEEPVASAGAESGPAAEVEAVEQGGEKELESLPLLPWANRRRAELLRLLDQLEASIGELDRAVAEQANARPAARRNKWS